MNENGRLLPVDAVRGIAMFFVGVSHISYYIMNDSAALASDLRAIGYIASPDFLLMSGLACGYQLAYSPTMATALRIVDRGLFVFLAGHLLVTASLVYMVPPGTAFQHVVITDTIGTLLCLAPLLKHTSVQRLVWIGVAVYFLSSSFALSWHPSSPAQMLLGSLLFSINDGNLPYAGLVAPTLPYLGIFLVGVGVGKSLAYCRRDGRSERLSRRLAVAGSIAVAVALVANVTRHFLKPFLTAHLSQGNWADVALTTLNIRHDLPPTLGYALFYAGIGIALVGYLGLLAQREPATPLVRAVRFAAIIGRASLVSYIVQQWLIDFIPIWTGLDSWLTPATVPIYLALTTLIMYGISLLWGRWKANQYLTLGYAGADGGRVGLFACVVAVVIALNILALLNASAYTPARMAFVPTNPYPWAPARLAGHHN